MTNHFPLTRLALALRSVGRPVEILAGAQGRSARAFTNGYSRGCQASAVHHTASSGRNETGDVNYLLNGKGEGFVISNTYTGRSGTIFLIASGPTYTEGRGGPIGIVPENGGNSVTFSNEVGGGLGAPFTGEQTLSVMWLHFFANQIAAEIWGWPDDPYGRGRLFAHFEYAPGRKIDPMGESPWSSGYTMWNMDAFRSDVRALAPTDGGSEMKLLPPDRLEDSRDGDKVPGGTTVTVVVPGARGCGAAQVTVTSQYTDAPGFLTAWAGGARPGTSFANPNPPDASNPDEARPHTLFVPLDDNGAFKLYTHSTTHLFVDFTGVALTK